MPARETEITLKRKEIIQQVIQENGYTRKHQVIEHLKEHPLFQLSHRTIREYITFDYEDIIDTGHVITGRSVLKDSNGKIKQEWVKTSVDKNKVLEATKIAIQELTDRTPSLPKIKKPKTKLNPDLLNQYTISDYHIGMMAVAAEVGTDWCHEKAADLLIKFITEGMARSPQAEECILVLLGDFQHFDNIEPLTPTSKHLLDASTRFSMLVRVTIAVIDEVICRLLTKYNKVNVIDAEGNHDISSSIWRRELFVNRFKNNPRVKIDQSVVPYYAFKWGSVALFYHHGHKNKIGQLDRVFVGMFKELFGDSEHVYAHTGHLHHQKMIENNIMILEQHQTLSAPDAHAVRGGYMSKRASKIITYSKRFGEVGRITINPEMLEHVV